MLRKTVFTVAVMAVVLSAHAQNSSYGQKTEYMHNNYELAIGLAAGLSGGNGVSLQKYFTPQHTLQINFFPYYSSVRYPSGSRLFDDYNERDSGYSEHGLMSLGLTYYYRIEEMQGLRILAYGNTSTMIKYVDDHFYDAPDYYSSSSSHVDTQYVDVHMGLGVGMGVAMTMWRFTGMLQAGFVGRYGFQEDDTEIGPSVDCSIHFFIKRRKK